MTDAESIAFDHEVSPLSRWEIVSDLGEEIRPNRHATNESA